MEARTEARDFKIAHLLKHRPTDLSIDMLDRKILYQLKQNARQSNKQIGKKVRASPEVVNYRIKRLVDRGYIKKFYTNINYPIIGLKLYRMYFLTEFFDLDTQREVFDFVRDKNYAWYAHLDSSWDFEINLMCKDFGYVYEFVKGFDQRFRKTIRKREIGPEIYSINLTYEFLLNRDRPANAKTRAEMNYLNKPMKIDDINKRILSAILFNSRASITELIRKTGISGPTIVKRLKQMEDLGIILEYTINITHHTFSFTTYKFNLKYLPQAHERIMSYLKTDRYVLKITKWLGNGDLQFTARVPNEKERDILINNIRLVGHKDLISIDYYKVNSIVTQYNPKVYFNQI